MHATRAAVVADEGPRSFAGVAIPLSSLPGGGTPILWGVAGAGAYAFSSAVTVVLLVPRAELGRGCVGRDRSHQVVRPLGILFGH